MTNLNFHTITFDYDPDAYSIALPAPLNELTDEQSLALMNDTLRILAVQVAADAARVLDHDFSDDDTDYFPARAGALATLIGTLTETDDRTATHYFKLLLQDHDFVTNILTCDMTLPIDIDFLG